MGVGCLIIRQDSFPTITLYQPIITSSQHYSTLPKKYPKKHTIFEVRDGYINTRFSHEKAPQKEQ